MIWKKLFSRNTEQVIDDVKAVIVTDVGIVRNNNEDFVRFVRPSQDFEHLGFLGVVADGMGGHQAGEVASALAVHTIIKEYYSKKVSRKQNLMQAIEKANSVIFKTSKANPENKGMGTTCTAVVIFNNQIILGHIGDSRLYLYQNNLLTQCSTDHTYVQELINQNIISEEEAQTHPQRNVLTKVMGTRPKVQPEIKEMDVNFEEGDRLLVCSDGLYEYFTKEELEMELSEPVLSVAAHRLVDTAKERGGHDNITVMLIERNRFDSNGNMKNTGEIEIP